LALVKVVAAVRLQSRTSRDVCVAPRLVRVNAPSHVVSFALVNARIRTGDPRRPLADAVAVSGGILVLVGSSAEVRKFVGAGARLVDVKGAMIRAEPVDAVLRRGAVASFVVVAPEASETERFRIFMGEVVLDVLEDWRTTI
jgi:hypothetical protein